MKKRVITSMVGIPILFLVLYFYHSFFFNLVIAAICLLAYHEIIGAFRLKKPFFMYLAVVPMTLVVLLSDYSLARSVTPYLLFFFILYIALCLIFEFKELTFQQVSSVVLFCGVVLFGFYALVSFKMLYPQQRFGWDAVYLIMLGFGISWGGDSAAYFAGSAFGKHKLAPDVSPHKTVEGAVGAVFGSIALAELFTFLYSLLLPVIEPGTTAHVSAKGYLCLIAVAAVGSVLGMLGDLFTSAIKRQCGIKDYGTIFPGHGGVLDRFDSVLFVMPFVGLISRFFQIIVR